MNLDLSLSYRRLLVIIRTGHDDCAALALGGAIAARCGALLLLRAFDDPSDPMPPGAALSWLSTTVARLSGQVREVSGELIARQPLHEAMRADIEALQPDLAIKELRRESALRRWLFTAEDTFLTRHATRPLLVVGENQSPLPKRVVAAVDPGPADQEEALNGRIVDEARRFADAVGAELQAAVGVRNGQRALDIVRHGLGCGVGQVVQRQDDDVVAHTDAAVLAPVAQEGGVFGNNGHDFTSAWF